MVTTKYETMVTPATFWVRSSGDDYLLASELARPACALEARFALTWPALDQVEFAPVTIGLRAPAYDHCYAAVQVLKDHTVVLQRHCGTAVPVDSWGRSPLDLAPVVQGEEALRGAPIAGRQLLAGQEGEAIPGEDERGGAVVSLHPEALVEPERGSVVDLHVEAPARAPLAAEPLRDRPHQRAAHALSAVGRVGRWWRWRD